MIKKYLPYFHEVTAPFVNPPQTPYPIDIKLDTATVELLSNYFYYRRICCYDEDKFKLYFIRNIHLLEGRYKEALELETQNIEWFQNYLKTTTTDNIKKLDIKRDKSDTVVDNKNINFNSTRTPDLTSTQTLDTNTKNTRDLTSKTDNDLTTNTNNNLTSTTDISNSDEINNKNLNKLNPMSISNSTPSFPSELDWTTSTSQEEGKGTTTSTGKTSTTDTSGSMVENTGTVTVTDTGNLNTSQTGTITDSATGTETTTSSTTEKAEKTFTEAETVTNSDNQNIIITEKGLSGVLTSEIIGKARDVIFTTSAFNWLKDELSICFYSLVDEDLDVI